MIGSMSSAVSCDRRISASFLVSVVALVASCGATSGRARTVPPVECQYTTVPPRFCGPSEELTLWRESDPQPMRVCNACLDDGECLDKPGGHCIELPGVGCTYPAFVCVYPDDPCFGEGEGCVDGECANREGRAVCFQVDEEPEGAEGS